MYIHIRTCSIETRIYNTVNCSDGTVNEMRLAFFSRKRNTSPPRSSTTFVIFRLLRTVGNLRTPRSAFYDSTFSNFADWVWRIPLRHTVNPSILNVWSHKRKLNLKMYNLHKNLIKFIRLYTVYVGLLFVPV